MLKGFIDMQYSLILYDSFLVLSRTTFVRIQKEKSKNTSLSFIFNQTI